jgi:glycine amidinotransferase
MITEFEPVFDAADFVRCGRDLFGIRSNVTNAAAFEWLRRHLARHSYPVHELQHRCRTAMHINSTFVPLAPGKVLVDPEYMDPAGRPPSTLQVLGHSGRVASDPAPLSAWRFGFPNAARRSASTFLCSIRRVLVEASQKTLIAAPKLGAPFGGSFHCATLDIRRRRELECYF